MHNERIGLYLWKAHDEFLMVISITFPSTSVALGDVPGENDVKRFPLFTRDPKVNNS